MTYTNHAIRAAVAACARRLPRADATAAFVPSDNQIASIGDIFELQRVPPMKTAEKRFLW